MSTSLGSSSRTLFGGYGDGGVRSSLMPLVDDFLPRFNPQDLEVREKDSELGDFVDVSSDVRGVSYVELKSKSQSWLKPVLSTGTLKLFASNPSFNCPGKYVDTLLKLDALAEYCAFEDGYSVYPPLASD